MNNAITSNEVAKLLGCDLNTARSAMRELDVPVAFEMPFGRGTFKMWNRDDVERSVPRFQALKAKYAQQTRERLVQMRAKKAEKRAQQTAGNAEVLARLDALSQQITALCDYLGIKLAA